MSDNRKCFLIVDDEPDLCWALENILKKEGMASEKVLNGCEALELVKKNRFDMAFLDAKLPDTEGLELARNIRAIDASILIVIVSGYYYKDDIHMQKALAEGSIFGFIEKPFQHDEILRIIECTQPNANLSNSNE